MIEYFPSKTDRGHDTIFISVESKAAFKELVQRGANIWPDAPAEIKILADLVTNGTVFQDYTLKNYNKL